MSQNGSSINLGCLCVKSISTHFKIFFDVNLKGLGFFLVQNKSDCSWSSFELLLLFWVKCNKQTKNYIRFVHIFLEKDNSFHSIISLWLVACWYWINLLHFITAPSKMFLQQEVSFAYCVLYVSVGLFLTVLFFPLISTFLNNHF